MAVSQAQVDALEAALVSGELTVEYEGHRVTYRSVAEIERALTYAKANLDGAVTETQQTHAVFCRD